jgi:WD40 repeat protein
VALAVVLAAVALARSEGAPPATDAEIARLIEQLGSGEFAEREQAQKRLAEVGEAALGPLRKALESDDAEVRRRARELVRDIERRLFGEQLCLVGHTGDVVSVVVSGDATLVVSGGNDGTARVWDLKEGKELRRLDTNGKAGVWAVALSPDGQKALVGQQNDMTLWEVGTGRLLRRFEAHPSAVRCIAFSPDGRRALTGCYDQKARLWDLETGKELRKFEGHTASVMSLAYSPDGKYGLTSGAQNDHTSRLWDLETGKELRKFEGHTERIMGTAFAPDGKRAVTGCWDGTARVWDVETGKQLALFNGHAGHVHGVAFSPDGKRVVSGGQEGAVRLWDAATGKQICCFEGHVGRVSEVRFVAGKIVSAGFDRSLRVWLPPK